jgi:hypothetical protein
MQALASHNHLFCSALVWVGGHVFRTQCGKKFLLLHRTSSNDLSWRAHGTLTFSLSLSYLWYVVFMVISEGPYRKVNTAHVYEGHTWSMLCTAYILGLFSSAIINVFTSIIKIKKKKPLPFFIQWHWIFMNRWDFQFKNDFPPQGLPTQWMRWCMTNLSWNPLYL